MSVSRGIIALLLAATAAPALADEAPVVAVPGGSLQGAQVEGAIVFRGIPFAAPPTGERRWKAPAPVNPWSGTRDASQRAPSCLQNSEGWNYSNYLHASEDCLTLDVRTPALSGKRPVMVWIHGGSNRSGAADGPVQSRLSDRGVVAVAIQYRLGALGFLSHRALAAEQGGSSGNYGLMDQIAALQWVKDNIAKFGGDPDQVTIYGESAGSQDVSLLLAAPQARGLFRAAIMQSGTPGFGQSFRSLEEGFKLGDQLDELAQSGGDVDRLRALSPVALLALQEKLTDPAASSGTPWLRATIDGKVLPDAPDRLLAQRPPLPVIVGTNTVEFGPGKGSVDLQGFARSWYGDKGAAALAAYQAEEAAGPNPRAGHLELRFTSDAEFICPANRLASHLAGLGWKVWRYEFDGSDPDKLTAHAREIGYVMGRKPVGGVQMQDYWVALAKGLDPNAPLGDASSRLKWPQLTVKRPTTLKFGNEATKAERGQPRSAFCSYSSAF